MSADAKAWKEGAWWHGSHDGACPDPEAHQALELEVVLTSITTCYGHPLYWDIRRYQDADGLVAYSYPRETGGAA
jgi:hypothetical protein